MLGNMMVVLVPNKRHMMGVVSHLDLQFSDKHVWSCLLDLSHDLLKDVEVTRESDTRAAILASNSDTRGEMWENIFLSKADSSHTASLLGSLADLTTIICRNKGILCAQTPAAYAAASSPLEWPTTADGVMFHVASRSTRAICKAVQSGCENSA